MASYLVVGSHALHRTLNVSSSFRVLQSTHFIFWLICRLVSASSSLRFKVYKRRHFVCLVFSGILNAQEVPGIEGKPNRCLLNISANVMAVSLSSLKKNS